MMAKGLVLVSIALACFNLSGCGGTDNSSTTAAFSATSSSAASSSLTSGPPAAPLATVSATTQKLHFSWSATAGATSYHLMQNPDGVSGFTQVGADLAASVTATSVAISVANFEWTKARFLVSACNSVGCTNSTAIDPSRVMLDAIGYFKASNPGIGDEFGGAIALSGDGNTLAVAARHESSKATGINGNQADDSDEDAGAVYVFAHTMSGWTQQAYVKASNTLQRNLFGSSLALNHDGTVLVVGATNEHGGATGVNGDPDQTLTSQNIFIQTGSGAVYVFYRAGQSWSQHAYIKASSQVHFGSLFGKSVAINASGDTIAVGAYGESSGSSGINGNELDANSLEAGAVYVFSGGAGGWQQQAYIKASNAEAQDWFGTTLALSGDGNTLAVSAPKESSNASGVNGDELNNDLANSGAVYMFVRNGGNWSQQAYIKASNPDALDGFGTSLALSNNGNTLAVGVAGEASSAVGINGAQNNNDAPASGAVYLFNRSGGSWTQSTYIKPSVIPSPTVGTFLGFGEAVALSADGTTLAVGAWQEKSAATGINGDQNDTSMLGAGAAYVFKMTAGEWRQTSYVKASNTQTHDYFGDALALSADGSVLAVGARGEDSRASGVNGNRDDDINADDNYGAVYLY